MFKLKIITSTVRPGRKGPVIGQWVNDEALAAGAFEVEFIELGERNLPLMNEAVHPAMRKYEHEHSRAWSQTIGEADAFIFVVGEYNNSYPAPLRNALEYLVHEWAYKPAGLVTYSASAFAGVRGTPALRADLAYLKMVPITEGVTIPMMNNLINDKNAFHPNELIKKSMDVLLKELLRWTKGMKSIREDNS